eukprot:4783187-Prymnesium_polylepis.3
MCSTRGDADEVESAASNALAGAFSQVDVTRIMLSGSQYFRALFSPSSRQMLSITSSTRTR